MKRVYQTIVDKGHGNCMQAAIASLFEKELEEVPKFIELKDGWFKPMYEFLNKNGYEYHGMLHNRIYTILNTPTHECFNELKWLNRCIMTPKKLYREQGVDGLFYAAVLSPNYFTWNENTTHAVIIDQDYNIIHDPNKEYDDKKFRQYPLTSILGYNGIINVMLINPK